MPALTKLATYLASFHKGDLNYDTACYLRSKLAEDLNDSATVNNGEDEQLEDTDVTMSTPEQQSRENTEGDIMFGAFRELDVQNKLKEEKEKIIVAPDSIDEKITMMERSPDMATSADFGTNPSNYKQASLFELLQSKLSK